MVGVDDSWVATVGRPSQLAFALSREVCALPGCSWAVSPIHLSFRACPQTQTATATKKIPSLREAIESKRSCRTLTRHSTFRLHASHFLSNTLVAMQTPALTWHTALGLPGRRALRPGVTPWKDPMSPRQTCLTATFLTFPSQLCLKMGLVVMADLSVLRACPYLGELPHNSVSLTHTTTDLS